jgi:hypothetical protein
LGNKNERTKEKTNTTMKAIKGGQEEQEQPSHILETFTVKVGETEVKVYCNKVLPPEMAFLSPELYKAVKAHFQKEADKTQSIKNAISSNESDQPLS